MYENTNPYTQNVDIANINQETILGGPELELSNYPMFNGPHEIADAVAAAGFDWVVHASNHSMDRGEAGIVSDRNYWDKFQDIKVTGINRSQQEADTAVILKRKGIKFGLLNYTYGTNGIELPEGKEYLVNLIDKEKMKKDIQKLKKQSDVIVVSMHWGEEYSFIPNEEQEELAQFLADQGVQVIIGSHPHVIQPMEFIEGKNGNKTLVIYSLGNFISAQIEDYQMLGGMARWYIVKQAKTGKYEVTDAEFWPTVTFYRHDGSGNMVGFKTYALKDYTDDIAAQHGLAPAVSRQYFIDKSNEVLGTMDHIKIVY